MLNIWIEHLDLGFSKTSRFLLSHSDDRVRICRKQHESVVASCLISPVPAADGGVLAWLIFFLAHFGPVVLIEHSLHCTAYPSSVADNVHPSSDGYFQQHNRPCQQAHIISNYFLKHDIKFTVLYLVSTLTRSQAKRAPLICCEMGVSHQRGAAKKICSNCMMLSNHNAPKSEECFQHHCTTKNLGGSESKSGSNLLPGMCT